MRLTRRWLSASATSVDVEGYSYSRLMERDEVGTLRTLTTYRRPAARNRKFESTSLQR